MLHPNQIFSSLCVGSIYISPRSKFKQETIDHIIQTIHTVNSLEKSVKYLVGGDFNKVPVHSLINAYGCLKSVITVPTRKSSTLESLLTDLHNQYFEPTTLSPLEVDDDKKGKNSDHEIVVYAPKSRPDYERKAQKKTVTARPIPESEIHSFGEEIVKHDWRSVTEEPDANLKANHFHEYLLFKYHPVQQEILHMLCTF